MLNNYLYLSSRLNAATSLETTDTYYALFLTAIRDIHSDIYAKYSIREKEINLLLVLADLNNL
jgi:hypothetical protein